MWELRPAIGARLTSQGMWACWGLAACVTPGRENGVTGQPQVPSCRGGCGGRDAKPAHTHPPPQCVVIGLQSTGEARTREVLGEKEGQLDGFVSAAE